MALNQVFPPHMTPENPVTERILKDPNVVWDVADDALVIAIKDQLLVSGSVRRAVQELDIALSEVAEEIGTLADIKRGDRPAGDDYADPWRPEVSRGQFDVVNNVEVWRLKSEVNSNSIEEARRLRALAEQETGQAACHHKTQPPAVSPNHVAILSPTVDGCPASPPHPAPAPSDEFIPPPVPDGPINVVVLDSGFIAANGAVADLNPRVRSVPWVWLNATTGSWGFDPPDAIAPPYGPYRDAQGALDEITGHGTFIAGLIARICPQTTITVVGLRDQEVVLKPLDPAEQTFLFSTEAAIAYSMFMHSNTDVIQCGFAFPTLDDYPSIPFTTVMEVLTGDAAPRPGVAVVAPAGNEASRRRYWPAALPDVIGVAATNRRAKHRAYFSNWGKWCNCCARGADVFSTFVTYNGPIEGDPPWDIQDFSGWATWDGTSFAAPQVSAAIACAVAQDGALTPVQAWSSLRGAARKFVTDYSLSGLPGVELPYLGQPWW
ncbi:MAG: S8/S53 family peptidase [Solirubrobacteraceae bacterium]